MNTFKYWLVANFEIFLGLFTIIVGAILMFTFISFPEDGDIVKLKIISYFSISALFLILLTFPTKNDKKGLALIILLLLPLIVISIIKGIEDYPFSIEKTNILLRWCWIFFSVGIIISGPLAYYTYVNIDEVVSRRMLYRNSNVDLFEFTWKYVLDRFFSITASIFICCFTFYLIICIIQNIDKIS